MKRIKSETEKNLEYCVETVKFLLKRTDITRKSISIYLGKAPNYLSHALNGAFNLNMKSFFKILELFKIEPADFFSYEYIENLKPDVAKVKELKSNAEKNLSRLGIK